MAKRKPKAAKPTVETIDTGIYSRTIHWVPATEDRGREHHKATSEFFERLRSGEAIHGKLLECLALAEQESGATSNDLHSLSRRSDAGLIKGLVADIRALIAAGAVNVAYYRLFELGRAFERLAFARPVEPLVKKKKEHDTSNRRNNPRPKMNHDAIRKFVLAKRKEGLANPVQLAMTKFSCSRKTVERAMKPKR